jgi:hypothetical protein
MNQYILTTTFLSIIAIVTCCLGGIYNFDVVQDAEATGCPTQFVTEHIDNAIKAYEDGDAKEVKNQLDLAKEAVGQFSEEEE